ncbi:flagellar biosynthesis protein flip [Sphingomonas sp. Leaf357]|uniref:flagellar type III secretion system pore protein FliP n=1 Tax=Sphingomonas sp. Leaf357 TaxID=1736350 RepID=UPI0006FE264B|nr:flagellar type III secretion system pore protein FliP [Sphingomonas sp. Leaf357]KQS03386.1 flagellar biosynthesis protein flip [Sphingomonas sp. Leaf357]
MKTSVTRHGHGPALIKVPRSAVPAAGGFGWIGKVVLIALGIVFALIVAHPAFAQAAPAVPAAPGVGDGIDRAIKDLGANSTGSGGQAPLALSLQVLIIMGLLSILPGILLMMTSFTRIIIVLAILRQAMGLQQTPPNQVLIGLSLFLSFFIMSPVISQINTTAIQPYSQGRIAATDMIKTAGVPLHDFMVKQTRVKDISMFSQIAKSPKFASPADIPFAVLLPSFVTSELKTAFQIGFLIFLPFIVIDLVVATVLMSLGMMMLSPTIISLPFKLLLFVLVDGWALTMGSLANSFVS